MPRTKPLTNLPYRFRYMNGSISKGGFKTFEEAVKIFTKCKHSGLYGTLYSDLNEGGYDGRTGRVFA